MRVNQNKKGKAHEGVGRGGRRPVRVGGSKSMAWQSLLLLYGKRN
jgi:hypothetical protein